MARQFLCTKTEPVVQTKAGKLRGFQLDGTYAFHGVKYADAKRFQQPTPVEPWEGTGLRLCMPDAESGSAEQRADGPAPLLAAR